MAGDAARETAYAKVNLALHVRRRRTDGYHDIETVFAFCAHGDVVTASPAVVTTLAIDGPFATGLSTTDNLVLRAAALFEQPMTIALTKYLPVASGIGGGSADAAATLRLMSRLTATALPALDAQRSLGADVPACVASTSARGEGVGERLSALTGLTGTPILLVNSRLPVSTADAFARWDGVDRGSLGDWRTGRNDLTAAATAILPAIGDVVAWLSARPGVTLARMSGSGGTCFALTSSISDRDRLRDDVARRYPDYWSLASTLR